MTKKKKHAFTKIPYEIWIEAELWLYGWDPLDANTDVIVTLGDGSRWVASFYSYQNIMTLVQWHRISGENLASKYLWGSDMILIEEVSRERITEVIRHLLDTGTFEMIFRRIDDGSVEEEEDLNQF